MLAASACSIELADTAIPADNTLSGVPPNTTPAAIDVRAHALSPRLVELTRDHQGPPNPHNEHLMQTRYKVPFESVDAIWV